MSIFDFGFEYPNDRADLGKSGDLSSGISPGPHLITMPAGRLKTPFNRKEVSCYLLWTIIILTVVAIIGYLVFYSSGREPLHTHHEGATVLLRLPGSEPLPRG
jgi:hypothetical protein